MNVQPQLDQNRRIELFDELTRHGQTDNPQWLAKIIASWVCGQSALPDFLGLTPLQFNLLIKHYFSNHKWVLQQIPSGQPLDDSRMLEKQDLINLLQSFSPKLDQHQTWLIDILVTACLGNDHLWMDMGFWCRDDLSSFLNQYFPSLASRNTKNMKWKKFLYKQLCEAEGLNLCRAPSCEVCIDYSQCFGSEE